MHARRVRVTGSSDVEKNVPTLYTPSALEHAKIAQTQGDGLVKAYRYGKKTRRGRAKGRALDEVGGKRKLDPDELLELSDGEISDSTTASVTKKMKNMGRDPGSGSSHKLPAWGVRPY